MVQLTNTLGTQNLKEHCNGIVNKHPGYTESQGALLMDISNTATQTNTLDTQNLKAHCNGIVNKHPGYTESQGALQWYS